MKVTRSGTLAILVIGLLGTACSTSDGAGGTAAVVAGSGASSVGNGGGNAAGPGGGSGTIVAANAGGAAGSVSSADTSGTSSTSGSTGGASAAGSTAATGGVAAAGGTATGGLGTGGSQSRCNPGAPTPASGGANYPFPQHRLKSYCIYPAACSDTAVSTAWSMYKSKFLVSAGTGMFRIQRPEASNDTVSEGISYGMLFSVYMNEKEIGRAHV
jgi:hypothetical protein